MTLNWQIMQSFARQTVQKENELKKKKSKMEVRN